LGWQRIFTEVHFLGNLKYVSKSPENKCNSIAQKSLKMWNIISVANRFINPQITGKSVITIKAGALRRRAK
jgi:hypothetical protein